MKVLSHFTEVELYWLMNGKGDFPSKIKKVEKIVVSPKANGNHSISAASPNSEKEIDRIVIFFKNGSFQNFENS